MTIDLDAINAALARCRVGPWYVVSTVEIDPNTRPASRWTEHTVYRREGLYARLATCERVEEAEFIARAPDWLRELVAEVERLRARVEP